LTASEPADGGWAVAPVTDWLLREGRFLADGNTFTEELAQRLVAEGAPVSRLRLSVRTLHPLYTGWSSVWAADGRVERNLTAPHGLEQRSSFIGSPMAEVIRTRETYRRRLNDLDDGDHAVLHELAAAGATDYFAIPMRFLSGRGGILVLCTDRPGGFGGADIASFERLVATLGPIVDAAAANNLARNVAAAYIGPRSGARVLDGRIERGDIETLRAAIWYSDLRGWSRLANELPAAEAVALANDYFELVDGAIVEHGGEVLKLIGDAVLAIFPVETDDRQACGGALDAAIDAQRRPPAGERQFTFGVGLHIGELVYGNVGSPTRLDFTVMGQAVNLATRIEGLTRPLDCPIILSEDFAATCARSCTDLGAHDVAGWDVPVRVLAPKEP
jgi:adenylate cyclase